MEDGLPDTVHYYLSYSVEGLTYDYIVHFLIRHCLIVDVSVMVAVKEKKKKKTVLQMSPKNNVYRFSKTKHHTQLRNNMTKHTRLTK